MKKLLILLTITLFSSLLNAQDKRDKRLVKKITQVSSNIAEIKASVEYAIDKKLSKALYKNILSKKELAVLDSDISRPEKLAYIDTIISEAKKDKKKYFLLSMVGSIQESSLNKQFDLFNDIIHEYGYLSKSRLQRLGLPEKLSLESDYIISNTPASKKNNLLELLHKERELNNISEKELDSIEKLM